MSGISTDSDMDLPNPATQKGKNIVQDKIGQIRHFWEQRASEYGSRSTATLGERFLRQLEIKTMIKVIEHYGSSRVLDVGCGNGYSTRIFAQKCSEVDFYGIDYSPKMVECAKEYESKNLHFAFGDVLDVDTLPDRQFDLVLTQRCIQNLPTYEMQCQAIHNILDRKAPEGVLALMECSKDGVELLNAVRMRLGRKPIEGIEPWHNNFLVDANMIQDWGATIVHFSSTYMFLTRVISSRLARIGYVLPAIGKFGYDKLYLIK